jgi:hypothetical protein
MEKSQLNWQPYGGGYLARPRHGCYLVYLKYQPDGKSIPWLAKFEASGMQKHPRTTLDFQEFASVEDAKAACEEHAHRFYHPLAMVQISKQPRWRDYFSFETRLESLL